MLRWLFNHNILSVNMVNVKKIWNWKREKAWESKKTNGKKLIHWTWTIVLKAITNIIMIKMMMNMMKIIIFFSFSSFYSSGKTGNHWFHRILENRLLNLVGLKEFWLVDCFIIQIKINKLFLIDMIIVNDFYCCGFMTLRLKVYYLDTHSITNSHWLAFIHSLWWLSLSLSLSSQVRCLVNIWGVMLFLRLSWVSLENCFMFLFTIINNFSIFLT